MTNSSFFPLPTSIMPNQDFGMHLNGIWSLKVVINWKGKGDKWGWELKYETYWFICMTGISNLKIHNEILFSTKKKHTHNEINTWKGMTTIFFFFCVSHTFTPLIMNSWPYPPPILLRGRSPIWVRSQRLETMLLLQIALCWIYSLACNVYSISISTHLLVNWVKIAVTEVAA